MNWPLSRETGKVAEPHCAPRTELQAVALAPLLSGWACATAGKAADQATGLPLRPQPLVGSCPAALHSSPLTVCPPPGFSSWLLPCLLRRPKGQPGPLPFSLAPSSLAKLIPSLDQVPLTFSNPIPILPILPLLRLLSYIVPESSRASWPLASPLRCLQDIVTDGLGGSLSEPLLSCL